MRFARYTPNEITGAFQSSWRQYLHSIWNTFEVKFMHLSFYSAVTNAYYTKKTILVLCVNQFFSAVL